MSASSLNVARLAARNLLRYQRRTLLTGALIVLGVLAVLLFVSVAGSFKGFMIGQITDSMLGHVQVHRQGYVASIDNLPLNLNMKPDAVARIDRALRGMAEVEAWSPRIKFGAMFSNFTETTNIRLNAVVPEREAATAPLMLTRFVEGRPDGGLVEPGKILVPELLARGMKLGVGDTVVLVATNLDGSVNGKTFVVQGVLASVTGPGGRDGYMHIDDARELLRMEEAEVSEIVVRLNDPDRLETAAAALRAALRGAGGGRALEVHTWDQLSPFANIARMIDLLTLFIRIMLVAIVLISIMNVMVMAVYERIREVGTMAAIGTQPRRILSLFMAEGLLLGAAGAAAGAALSLAAIWLLRRAHLTFSFGQQDNLVLVPAIGAGDIMAVAFTVIGVAVLASLQPAWKASRMDPITALRHV